MKSGFPRPRGNALTGLAMLMGILILMASGGCSKAAIIKVDGSSTVFPITEAMAEEFQKAHGEFRVTVGISGTGGGFKKFCNKEIHIAGASRPIKRIEVEACKRNGVDYIELPIALDGLSVIVNPENGWVDSLTVEELREIWEPDSKVDRWSDVRSNWPDRDVELVGADTDSGTFDYFTKAIVGEEGASRPDYTSSADDNVLVRAVALDEDALGYLGFAFYVENPDKLKLVPVDSGSGPVRPSVETIGDGSYAPLSRPLFIYISSEAAQLPRVRQFVNFYLSLDSGTFIREVGYVALPEHVSRMVQDRFKRGITGSVFGGQGSQVGVSIEELLGEG